MAKKGRDEGVAYELADAPEPEAFVRDHQSHVHVAAPGGRRDYGPAAARQTIDARTGLPVLRPPKRVLERLRVEVDGRVQEVARVMTPLKRMKDNGTISEEQYGIGVDFKLAFDHGSLHGLKASDISRAMGAGGNGQSAVQLDGRAFVWKCYTLLGGPTKIMSVALTHVVGLEFSLRDLSGEHGRVPAFWSDAVVSALDSLEGRVPVYARGGE